MGRPRDVKPLPTGTRRRNFLKRSLPAAMAASAAPLLLSAAGKAFAQLPGLAVQRTTPTAWRARGPNVWPWG